MNNHDPLCPYVVPIDARYCEECPRIARVRADERERAMKAIRNYAEAVGRGADSQDYFGVLSTGQAVGIALAAAEGIIRNGGKS